MPSSITIGELGSGVEAIDTDLLHIQRGLVDLSLPVAELLKQGPQGPRGLKGDPGSVTTISIPGPVGPQGPRGPAGDPGGLQGPPGNAGPPGSPGAVGPRGLGGASAFSALVNRGAYSTVAIYSLYDLVSLDGSSFVWMLPTSGNEQPSVSLAGAIPPDSAWQLLAQRGPVGPNAGAQGPQGVPGPKGIQGFQGPPGPQFIPQGAWDGTRELVTNTLTFIYHQYDLIHFEGSSYYWFQEYPGNVSPPDPDYWQLIAKKGDIGPSGGQQGLQGEQGLPGVSVIGPTGLTGDVGPRGLPGSPYLARGEYADTTQYNQFDYINLDGASYFCRATAGSLGNIPPNTGFWQLVSSRGVVGPIGLQGIQGGQGIQGIPGSPYNPRGVYNSAVSYNQFDYVSYQGASYYWRNLTAGNSAITSTDWQLVADRGTVGPIGLVGDTGPVGPQGVPGSPYNSRGAYTGSASYNQFDYVNFNGASYYWNSATSGNTAPPGISWQLVASQGITGPTGQTGLTGPTGLTGSQGVPGSPYNPRGIYNSVVTYNQFDYVSFDGASYYWRNSAPGNASLTSIDWQLVSDRGPQGLQGAQGIQGIQGATGANGQSFNSRGLYSVVGNYTEYDYVNTAAGSSYVWVSSSNGNSIPPSSDWQLVAQVGAQGIQGVQGVQGSQGIQGEVGESFNARGTYNATAIYNQYDYVDYLGSSYWWIAATPGSNSQPPSANWQLVSNKGEPGTTGTVGSLSEGNKGDITVSNSGDTWTINTNSVELNNIQEISTNRLLGRSSVGQGAVEQLAIGPGLQVLNSILSAQGITYSQPNEPVGAAPGTVWIDTDESVITGWQLITGNYSVQAGDKLILDCTNPIILLLPPNPLSGTEVELTKYIGSATVSIDTNGLKFNGAVPVNLRYTRNSALVDTSDRLVYTNNTIGWISVRKQVKTAAILTYVSNGDTNGLVYYLGTNGLATVFANPAVSGQIAALASTTQAGAPTAVTDRIANEWYSTDTIGSWLAWDLGTNSLSVSKYTLRSRSVDPTSLPRSWVLEGTNTIATSTVAGYNAAAWTIIDTRTSDTTLTTMNQYYTLTANGSTADYRYLRLRQTGFNSNGAGNGNFFTLNEIEFYGTLSF